MAAWAELLDALEERTRRVAALADGAVPPGSSAADVPDVALEADGPLPAHLVPRAAALLAETTRLADQLQRRSQPLARAQAAYASH